MAAEGREVLEHDLLGSDCYIDFMAVNHVDGTMFISVLLYPVAAGLGAASAGASWLMLVLVPAGLAIGIGITYLGQKLVYAVLGFAINLVGKMREGWIQQVVFAPFFLLYLALPLAIVMAGLCGTWSASAWLAELLEA